MDRLATIFSSSGRFQYLQTRAQSMPSSGKPYKYVPLTSGEETFQIGVVKILLGNPRSPITCGLKHVTLQRVKDSPNPSQLAFDALSYVWGDTNDRLPILIDGKELLIIRNLWLALYQLRESFTADPMTQGMFWIDAICIDQTNLDERSHQVRLMAVIYSQARQVVVWLGEEDKDSRIALHFMLKIKRKLDEAERQPNL
jgi:hypothetical protein